MSAFKLPVSYDSHWSPQQTAVFDHMRKGGGNLVVRARAGTGKTTTIVKSLDYAIDSTILVAAFNKTIAVELQSKVKRRGTDVKTLHALGMGFIGANWRVQVDNDRSKRLAYKGLGLIIQELKKRRPELEIDYDVCAGFEIQSSVRKIASLTKNSVPDLTLARVIKIAENHEAFPDEDELEKSGLDTNDIAKAAIAACQYALEYDGTIDFDDMIFIPVALDLARPKWSMVIVDEAQDMNPTQLILAQRCCKNRMIIVGDDRQAIYGFRGADSNAIDRMKRELNAEELGLTITYRCPKSVVEYAQYLVPDYKYADAAPVGVIRKLSVDLLAEEVRPGDFVLSRLNSPLVSSCLATLRAGKPAKISGKDFSRTLMSLVNKFGTGTMEMFLLKLTKWQERQIEKARLSNMLDPDKFQEKVIEITDLAETLRALSDGCVTQMDLKARIENMFVDDTKDPLSVVLFSSIHKAKGQERHRVFLFQDSLYPRGDRTKIEERNLEYVGVTRTKHELIWVEGGVEKKIDISTGEDDDSSKT